MSTLPFDSPSNNARLSDGQRCSFEWPSPNSDADALFSTARRSFEEEKEEKQEKEEREEKKEKEEEREEKEEKEEKKEQEEEREEKEEMGSSEPSFSSPASHPSTFFGSRAAASSEFSILAKFEDVRRDVSILQCIRLLNKVWEKANLPGIFAVVYDCMPVASDMGCMEFIPSLVSLHDLAFHFVDHEAIDQLARTAAASVVAGYVLGIGDRHDGNIQIRRDGSLFHLDFGFILGQQPVLDTGPIPITNELWHHLGENSRFQDFCVNAFMALRDEALNIIPFLEQMLQPFAEEYARANSSTINSFLIARLGVTASELAARRMFSGLLQGTEDFPTWLKNFVHNKANP